LNATTPRGGRLPGDPTRQEFLSRTIRVNHAGEYGAVRIYEGQLAVLRDRRARALVTDMVEKEREHLGTFSSLLVQRRVRPTVLQPVWRVAGFMLGATTAALGAKAAMACTVAVEEVIDDHYAKQIARLGDDERDLRDLCHQYRQDEIEHRDVGRREGAEDAPAYPVLTAAIKAGSRAAIWLSERI
jgi:3-demethoxyubiquinol 3-hydroxylase